MADEEEDFAAMLDASFDQNRYPTSRMGAADLIRNTFQQARAAAGLGHPGILQIFDVLARDRHRSRPQRHQGHQTHEDACPRRHRGER